MQTSLIYSDDAATLPPRANEVETPPLPTGRLRVLAAASAEILIDEDSRFTVNVDTPSGGVRSRRVEGVGIQVDREGEIGYVFLLFEDGGMSYYDPNEAPVPVYLIERLKVAAAEVFA